MNPQIKFVYFDIGGVLFDEGGTDYLVKQYNINPHKFRRARWKYLEPSLLGKISTDDMHLKTLKEFGVQTNITNFNDYWAKNSKGYPVGHKLIKAVSQKYPVGLLTNNTKDSLEYYVKYNLIPDLEYSQIIQSSELGVKKPFPEIYKIAQEKVELKPAEILFIDDRKINTDAAEKLGWQAIEFDRKNQTDSAQKILNLLEIEDNIN